jgi:hypothetical protein
MRWCQFHPMVYGNLILPCNTSKTKRPFSRAVWLFMACGARSISDKHMPKMSKLDRLVISKLHVDNYRKYGPVMYSAKNELTTVKLKIKYPYCKHKSPAGQGSCPIFLEKTDSYYEVPLIVEFGKVFPYQFNLLSQGVFTFTVRILYFEFRL